MHEAAQFCVVLKLHGSVLLELATWYGCSSSFMSVTKKLKMAIWLYTECTLPCQALNTNKTIPAPYKVKAVLLGSLKIKSCRQWAGSSSSMAATIECSCWVRADSDRGAGFHVSPKWFATLILNNAHSEILTFTRQVRQWQEWMYSHLNYQRHTIWMVWRLLRLLLAGLLIFHAQITMPIISKQKAPGVKVVTC